MKRAGYSEKELTAHFQRSVARAPRSRTYPKVQTKPALHDTGQVVTLWESDPDCVDADGKPKALPIRGPAPSVEALLKRARPNLPLEEALDFFDRTRALRKVGQKLIPTDESVIHSTESETLAAHQVLVLNQLLLNFEFNSKVGPGAPRWIQRVVECPDFPANELPRLLEEFAKRANRFLKSYDHSLTRIARKAAPNTPRVRPGINLFFVVAPPARNRPQRSRSSRSD
jgi:hypothetical protein